MRVTRVVALLGALTLAGCTSSGSGGSLDAGSPGAGTSGADSSGVTVAVERVVDGDTIVVDGGERVRFIGIDTPETKDPRRPVECFGEAASRRTEQLLPVGTQVVLEYDVERLDRYDRTLAYVYRADDDLFVNLELVAGGYASAYSVPPNVAHADDFVAAERDAREAGRGLWSAC